VVSEALSWSVLKVENALCEWHRKPTKRPVDYFWPGQRIWTDESTVHQIDESDVALVIEEMPPDFKPSGYGKHGPPLQDCTLPHMVALHVVWFSSLQMYDVKGLRVPTEGPSDPRTWSTSTLCFKTRCARARGSGRHARLSVAFAGPRDRGSEPPGWPARAY
jgi:hypothetical protein